MEDEIDIGKYLAVLKRGWKWIVGLAIISAGVALFISLLAPPAYEATALVIITRARYQLQFDPRIQTQQQTQQAYRVYPELAMSDDLISKVVETVNGGLPLAERQTANFQAKLSAEASTDPSLVRLSVVDGDPQRAQMIANTWVELYVAYANDLYQPRAGDVVFFQTQVAEAGRKLESTERALVDFQSRNTILMLTLELTSTQTAVSDYLTAQRTIALVTQDAQSLQQQLAQQEAGGRVTLTDELTALFLQVNALSTQPGVPIQLQIGGDPLVERTVSEQAELLESLISVLQDKSAEIDRQIESLKPELLRLQTARQETQVESDRLTRDCDTARDTYLTLTRKLDEASVAANDLEGEVRLASRATLPTAPVSPRQGLNTALGGLVGLMLGVVAALVSDGRQPARRQVAAALKM